MTTMPSNPTTALPARPPLVDLATWQAARDELLVHEKAHTREGDALAALRRRGAHHLFPARRRPRVPHLLHDGPGQRAGRRDLRPARHDALRPRRGVGGQPRGLARGAQLVLVLAVGRGWERHLGPDQPPRAAVDPPRRDPRRDPRPARPPPLTRLGRRRRQRCSSVGRRFGRKVNDSR
jgi:hypothetical protein